MTYEQAYERSGKAIRAFTEAQQAYRSRKIGDVEFLAAKAKYNAAMAEYDEAYAREQAKGEERESNMARRVRLVRRNQGSTGELPYGEWIPAHAVKFNTDGTTSLMTESEHHAHNRGRRRNVAKRKPAARRKARRR